MWIIDASVAVRWFLEDEAHENADAVLRRLLEEPGRFAVPELFAFEVYAVLNRLHPNGAWAFGKGVIPLLQGGLLRQPMTSDLASVADQFVEKGLTGYDACYAALAIQLKGCWLTFDEKAHQKIAEEEVSCLLSDGMPPGW
ncbi:MAG: type II toxin-antitoxin system VapC family toxin [Deltaproteobacteria bacterium]|nr:type II toxin-antitoxin system VapC family toxin [Deltaproteobacteria bacterium]